MESLITRDDVGQFTFDEYEKIGTTKLSREILGVGQVVDTLEGQYTCAEQSRLAIDASGNVYPVACSIFEKSYRPCSGRSFSLMGVACVVLASVCAMECLFIASLIEIHKVQEAALGKYVAKEIKEKAWLEQNPPVIIEPEYVTEPGLDVSDKAVWDEPIKTDDGFTLYRHKTKGRCYCPENGRWAMTLSFEDAAGVRHYTAGWQTLPDDDMPPPNQPNE